MKQKLPPQRLTPTEIIELYPDLQNKFGWTPPILGVLLKAGLLLGVVHHKKRISEIEEESIKRLVEYRNSLLDTSKVTI